MPELPEVETIVRDLRQDLVGKIVKDVHFLTHSVWRKKQPRSSLLVGFKITGLSRRGKNILMFCSNGMVLVVHLKMTGRLTVENIDNPLKKHTHFTLDLSNGRQLRFNDVRRFGYLDLIKVEDIDKVDYLAALGPDALSIGNKDFIEFFKSKKRIIKSLLLDQSIIAGMGNIYSDEALYMSGIHPRRVSSGLSRERLGRLHKAMIEVLNKALDARGSSVDNYVDGRGGRGSFQNQHLVYGREGEQCKKCGHVIKREIIGSRSAHFCPKCQK